MTNRTTTETDFTLTTAQMTFMMNIDAAAERADAEDNDAFFVNVLVSSEWQQFFGDMSWDQAYDRYEIMIGRSKGKLIVAQGVNRRDL